MLSKKACTKCICAATGIGMLIIVICLITVMGRAAPISVTGSDAHIKEINKVNNSLFEVNNRINISGVGIGSVLLLIF